MAAVYKAFVVKNGLEVSTDLILADANTRKVGIATTAIQYTLHVNGGIGATDLYVSGIGTFANELNVGLGGTVLTVLGVGNSIGVGTANPAFLLDIRSPVSTGQTALYVQGDIRVTGDIRADDISITNLNVSGVSTFVGFATFNNNILVAGISTFVGFATFSNNIFVAGISTLGTLKISSGIVTATSGIITYFGDGSNLTGLSGNPNLQTVLNVGNTSSTGISITGVSTLTTLNSTNGTITNLTGTAATITNASGTVKIGIGTTALLVEGNARVTGILTVGSSSITLNGITDTINVGTGLTLSSSGINVSGVITATSFVGNGSGLTGAGSTIFIDTTTNQEFFPLFTATKSGTITASGISTSKLTYNPSTGTMTAVDFNSTSDINLKENIHTVGNALEITEQLRGVSFDWKETGKGSYGVIAQELQEILPDLVKNGEVKSVNYNGIIGVLIEAIKELKKEVEDLKNTK